MTARMVVMMTPDEKRAIGDRARLLDMSPSEMLRRAGRSYDAVIDDAVLEVLATTIEQNNAELRMQLDEVMARVDFRLAEIKRLRTERDTQLRAERDTNLRAERDTNLRAERDTNLRAERDGRTAT